MSVNPASAEGEHTWLDVQNHLHRLLPEGYHGVQACQVEIIFDKVFRHFTEVLVAGQRTKPANPRERGSRGRRCW